MVAGINIRSDRVVLVTGAARGIGAAIASAFARHGDTVCLADVLANEVTETAASLGGNGYELDVADADAFGDCVRRVEKEIGPIDVLINNAGVMSRSSVEETTEAEWDRVMGINAKGVFNGCHAVIPHMSRRRRGWIINIGSIWASHAWPNRSVYAASKAAVEQFTRCFALEAASHGVLVNAISPGIMASEMTKRIVEDEAFRKAFMTRVALGTIGQPIAHVSGLALYLTSPDAGYMSGEVVEVHGGYY